MGVFYPQDYFSSRPGRNAKRSAVSLRQTNAKCRLVDSFAPKPGGLLEVGSANGDFLVAMRDRGWEVQGVELSPDASEFSRRQHGLTVSTGELPERPDDGTRFDMIVLWAVLPHIANPVETISCAERLLAEEGRLMICCANIESYASRSMKDRWAHLDQPRHYCHWSPETLRRLYASSGLVITRTVFHDDIFDSQFVLPWLSPLTTIADDRPGISLRKLTRRASEELNKLLTRPIAAWARARQRGGILTVVGTREPT
jgi:SAM-dependent methyltransferase